MADLFPLPLTTPGTTTPTLSGTGVLARTPLTDLRTWAEGRGLQIVLVIIGSVLLARFAEWLGTKITDRIDSQATGNDALVRSEAAKHRHSLTQVLTWTAVVLIYAIAAFYVLNLAGVPITGLVAPATVLGVGLGFGAQRVVGDVLAGFFLITERQYGFGDVVEISVTGATSTARGTVEDVTLRITRLRSADGEVVTVSNGQIVKVVNLSRDWARAVVDVPVPTSADIGRVNELLRDVGARAFADPDLAKLLLDEPSVMGVESLGLDQVNVRVVARTLPGRQFEVGRDLRARIVQTLRREGVTLAPGAEEIPLDGTGGHPDRTGPTVAGAPPSGQTPPGLGTGLPRSGADHRPDEAGEAGEVARVTGRAGRPADDDGAAR